LSDLILEPEQTEDAPQKAPASHWVSVVCECGKKIGAHLSHYEILVCYCDRKYWAMRPKRFGPLVLFPYPGCWQEGTRLEVA